MYLMQAGAGAHKPYTAKAVYLRSYKCYTQYARMQSSVSALGGAGQFAACAGCSRQPRASQTASGTQYTAIGPS